MGGSNSGGGNEYEFPAAYFPTTVALIIMLSFALGMTTAKHIHDTSMKISVSTTQGLNV